MGLGAVSRQPEGCHRDSRSGGAYRFGVCCGGNLRPDYSHHQCFHRKGNPVNNPFERGTLLWAVWRRNIADVLDALGHGADANAVVEEYIPCISLGSTPLHLAARLGHAGIVDCLIEHDADVDARDFQYEYTPLHCAAAFGSKMAAAVLLRNGAKPNERDCRDRTYLYLAAYNNHPSVIRALRADPHTDVSIADERGRTPLAVALQRNCRQAAAALRQ